MKAIQKLILVAMIVGMALGGHQTVYAQAPVGQQPAAPPPAPAQKEKAPEVAPLTLDSAPPVNAEEDAAWKAFQDAPNSDLAKKEQLGEDFVQKYPQSRYRAEVYGWLVLGYSRTGPLDKMESAGDKELALNPNDPQALAVIGSALPRAIDSKMSEADREKRLAKAEEYCKKALEILPTFPKPANVSDDAFVTAKNQISAMAYSGLGIAAYRRGRYADGITNLEQALKLESTPDPVDMFVLGICNEKASHFDDAVAIFTRCAAMPGGMQTTCKAAAEEAKKLAATQLSVPK